MNLMAECRRLGAVTTAMWLGCAMGGAPYAADVDAIYINGNVVTVDAEFAIAESFAVSDGKFVAVGHSSDVIKRSWPGTKIYDLNGRTVVPGFIDAHPHIGSRARNIATLNTSLAGLGSIAAILKEIEKRAQRAAPGSWIITSPIGEAPDYFHLPEALTERRWPTRTELDRAAPHNPVYIPSPSTWPYPALFNSMALTVLDITRSTTDVDLGARVVRDAATGEPTGQIHGLHIYNRRSPLFDKLRALTPAPTAAAEEEGLRKILRMNLEAGVTAVYEAHGNFAPTQLHERMRTIRAAGGPINRTVSTYEVPRGMPVEKIGGWMETVIDAKGAGTGDDYFKTVGITVALDGATQFGASLMREPYLDPYGATGNGSSAYSEDELLTIARLAAQHNLRLNLLGAGDKACDMIVNVLEAVNHETPITGRSWVVQHVQHPSRRHIATLKQLGVVATTYSSVDYSKGAETYIKMFPGRDDIWRTVIPLRWWFDGGVTVAQSTDGAHYEPIFTLWESMVRVDGRTGKSLLTPEKTITREEAIRMYTINGARVMQWQNKIGSIENGKFADFVVLDRDILTGPLDAIRDAAVVQTVVGGEILYGQDAIANPAR
ncbi:MAG: amidohydrolase family protein [Rhodospirillaceae bacterium]|nr:amidohydrolase family protein [Rhodospirillaceae bacterium]